MEFSRQEYWSGFPFPSPGDLSDLGMEPGSPALQVDSLANHCLISVFRLYKIISYVVFWEHTFFLSYISMILLCCCTVHLFVMLLMFHCMDMCMCLVTQLCLTLCEPKDSSPPGSSVPGILQTRILEWVAIAFSNCQDMEAT